MTMAMVTEIFAQFEGTDSNKQGMGTEELKAQMEKELPGFLQSRRDQEAVDKLLKNLDASGNTTVDLSEFILFVAAISSACHVYLEQKALNGCPTDPDS